MTHVKALSWILLLVPFWLGPGCSHGRTDKVDHIAAKQRQLVAKMRQLIAVEKTEGVRSQAFNARLRDTVHILRQLQQLLPKNAKERGLSPLEIMRGAAKRFDPTLVKKIDAIVLLKGHAKRYLQAALKNTRAKLKSLQGILFLFALDNGGRYPTSKKGFVLEVTRLKEQRLLKDIWGHDIVYERSKGDFSLRSIGLDGRAKTADDIVLDSKGRFHESPVDGQRLTAVELYLWSTTP
jgi:hypothetical protein